MTGESGEAGSLLRILGLVFGIAAVAGGMIGQGILRTPGIIAGAVHSPETIVLLWLAGAAIVAISAFAYVELGSAIPCAGGPYDFVRRAFGTRAGVVAGWAAWLVLVSTMAFLATVVAEFLHRLGVWPGVPISILALFVLALFWALNLTGTRIAGDSQVVFSAAKGAGLVALIVLLFASPETPAPATDAVGDTVGIVGFAIAMRAIINTYDGWQDTVYHCEELKRPEQTLARSMALGVAGVTVLYLLTNLAMLQVLSPAEMASSNLPAADAARLILGPAGDVALTAFGVLSVAAITNLYTMRSARLPFAMAREGQLPAWLSRVTPSGTPRAALGSSVVLAGAFAATGTYETIVAISIALSLALVIAVNAAAIRLRRIEPDLPRTFRIPFYPVPVLLAIAVNMVLMGALVFEDPVHSVAGFALLAFIGATSGIAGIVRRKAAARAA